MHEQEAVGTSEEDVRPRPKVGLMHDPTTSRGLRDFGGDSTKF